MSINWLEMVGAPEKLAAYKAEKKEFLSAERDRLIYSGIEFQGHRYQTKDSDVQNLMGALQIAQIASAQGTAFSTTWLTEDNTQVVLSLPLLAQLGTAVAMRKTYLVYKCRGFKDEIDALGSIALIDAFLESIVW